MIRQRRERRLDIGEVHYPTRGRADITAEVAWSILELEGERKEIDDALAWVAGTGVRVDPVEDSIIEG